MSTPPTSDPNFDIYASQRGRIIGTMVALFIITSTAVGLRFLSRKLSRAGLWWDDWLCLVALFVTIMLPSIHLYELRNGFGRHIYIYSPEEQIEKSSSYLQGLYAFEFLFHIATTMAKFSILAFYHRVFALRGFRRLVWFVAALCMIEMIGVILAIVFQCQPIHYAWDLVRPDAKGHCFRQDNFFKGSGAVNAVLNLLIFVMPIPLVGRLRTTVKQRIVLLIMFTLAGFVVIVSVIWIIVLSKLQVADVTWNQVEAGIWSAVEPSMAVVCACIPSLRPLYSVLGRGFAHASAFHSSSTSSGGGSSKRWGSTTKQSEGSFSQMDEDDQRPLGHDVSVRGGTVNAGQTDEEAMEMPQKGIAVRTEITLVTSDRLDYNDRLF